MCEKRRKKKKKNKYKKDQETDSEINGKSNCNDQLTNNGNRE